MPNNELISEIIDEASVEAQIARLTDGLRGVEKIIKEFPQLKMDMRSGGIAEYADAMQKAAAVNKEMIATSKSIEQAQQRLAQAQSEEGQRLAEVRAQAEAVNRSNKEQAKQALGLVDAYTQLSKQAQAATKTAKNLAAAFGEEDQRTKDAAAKAKILNDQLKSIDASVGQYQRNVGNYTGAISVLEKALQDVTTKIDQFTAAGQDNDVELEKLRKEQGLLEVLVSQQSKGFASLTAEIRNNERALATMFEQGMQNTEAFKQIQASIATAKREVMEFNEQQKILSSQTPIITSLTLAAKGLAGAYAIGQGAAALFADGNEKLEKELNKMVAVMTILQGLREAHELLEKKSTIATVARTAAQKLWNFVLTGSTAAHEEVIAATAAENIVTAENAAIKEESAAATVVAAESEVILSNATRATAIAMQLLRGAIIATGIGAIIVLFASAANAQSKFTGKAKEAKENLKDLGETIGDIAKNELSALDEQIKQLNDQLGIKTPDAAQKAKDALILLDEDVNRLQKKKGFFDFDLSWQGIKESFNKIGAAFGIVQDEMTEKQQQAADIRIKAAQIEALKQVKAWQDALQNGTEAYQEISNDNAELAIDANNRILQSDKSTYSAKLTALRDNLNQQKTIIQNNLNKGLADTTDPAKRNALIIKANNELIKAQRDFNDESVKIFSENSNKLAQDAYDLGKARTEAIAASSKAIMDNEKQSYDARLLAANNYFALQKQLVQEEAQFTITTQHLKGDALIALQIQTGTKLAELSRQQMAEVSALTLAGLAKLENDAKAAKDKQQQSIAANTKAAVQKFIDANETGYVKDLENLNNQLKNKKITYEQFEKQRTDLTDKYNRTVLNNQVALDEALIENLRAFGFDTTAIEQKLLDDKKRLYDLDAQNYEKSANEKKKTDNELAAVRNIIREKEKAIEQESANFAKVLGDAKFENEINNLQTQIDANTKLKDEEISRITNSTLSEEQKAARIQIINAEAQAKQDQLDKKKKDAQIAQAKFERDFSIAEVTWNTARAIMKDSADPLIPPFLKPTIIAEDIALGALQIAAIMAKPIPKYAEGTGFHPGGPAIVGDAGRELIQLPGGLQMITPEKDTLIDLPRGSKVIPNDQINQFMLQKMMQLQPTILDDKALLKEISGLRSDLKQQIAATKDLKNQKPPTVIVKNEAGWNDYLRRAVYE